MGSAHVNIAGNEIADALAKDGVAQPTRNSVPLIYSELHSTYINNPQSSIHPAHHCVENPYSQKLCVSLSPDAWGCVIITKSRFLEMDMSPIEAGVT
ncbi:hypothetical protein TNCV_5080631 [Trichonephila clavipes]|nr:hypothetical protein TNCV_5080631 [Trichonephila clavipes]